MPQASVNNLMPIAVEGIIGDLDGELNARIGSATNTEASALIRPGLMVARDPAVQDGVKLLHTSAAAMAANNLLRGVALTSNEFSNPQQVNDDNEIRPGVTFGVCERGPVWVRPEDAVTPSSDVRVRVVVAGAEKAGAFRGAADATDCVDISAFARWITPAGAGELALLWIDTVNVALATADS
jgi:hypothetical protein